MSTLLKLSPSALEKIGKNLRLQEIFESKRPLQQKAKPENQKLEKKRKYKELVQKRNTVIHWLCEQYPLCFSKTEPMPLKVGIIKDILAALPEDADSLKMSIRKAVAYYAHTKSYLQSLISHPCRYDLDGNQVGDVSKDNRMSAQLKLDEMAARIEVANAIKK